MIVVCSGAKIVLDLPATREWLETYASPWSAMAATRCPRSIRDAVLCQSMCVATRLKRSRSFSERNANWESKARSSLLSPSGGSGSPQEILNKILDESLCDAEDSHIAGRELTPFLLARACRAERRQNPAGQHRFAGE